MFDKSETINKIMIININLSHKYFSYYSIIKFVDLELIYYAINMDVVSFFILFKEFVFVFLSISMNQ